MPLASHGLNSLPRWANECDSCLCAFPRECWVLTELQPSVREHSARAIVPYKTVAWVYALAALLFGNLDDAVAV
jgi:hypothetical protein